jgi:hypothetical protein
MNDQEIAADKGGSREYPRGKAAAGMGKQAITASLQIYSDSAVTS